MGNLGMKMILLFLLFLIAVKAQHKVSACNKGGLLIFCKTKDEEFKDKEKYLCKGNAKECLHNYQNRTVRYRNINRVYATILMKNLTSEDEGTYHCASEGGIVHSSFDVTVKEGGCSDLPIRILAHEDENINVTCKCPYYKSRICPKNIKHFCKEHEDFIESGLIELKSSSVKYSLTENSSADTFNVTIYKLERKDAGMYWCGIQTGGDNIALTAQVNLLITGRLEEVRGVVGGGVAIVCKFDDPDQLNQKQRFFCKGNASTCPYNRLSSTDNNRVALYRNAYGDFLTIVMKNLTENDSGTYYCAENGEARTKVQLNIDDGDRCDTHPKMKEKNKGDNVTIQCTYPVEYQGKKKYFCKEGGGTMRMDLLKSRPSYSNLKYSTSENKAGNLFTVTIYNLDMYDTATYWCGMGSGGHNVALFTKVELNVLVNPASGMKPADDAVGQGIKTAGGVVTTLLVAAAFFLCYIQRQKRKQENTHNLTYFKAETQNENSDADSIYEEIDDLPPPLPPPPPPPTSEVIYTMPDDPYDTPFHSLEPSDVTQATVHAASAADKLPRIPFENNPYDTPYHSLKPSDITQAAIHSVYATATLPTTSPDNNHAIDSPSDSNQPAVDYVNTATPLASLPENNHSVNAMATLPTNLSEENCSVDLPTQLPSDSTQAAIYSVYSIARLPPNPSENDDKHIVPADTQLPLSSDICQGDKPLPVHGNVSTYGNVPSPTRPDGNTD